MGLRLHLVRPDCERDQQVERQPDHGDQGRRPSHLGQLLVDLVGRLLGTVPDILSGEIFGSSKNPANVVKSTGGEAHDLLLHIVEQPCAAHRQS